MNQRTLTFLSFAPLAALVGVGAWFYFDGNMASVKTVMAGFLVTLAIELVVLYSLIRNDEEFQRADEQPEQTQRPEIIDADWSIISGRDMVISDENLEIWMVKAR